jgi:hypothetical protein
LLYFHPRSLCRSFSVGDRGNLAIGEIGKMNHSGENFLSYESLFPFTILHRGKPPPTPPAESRPSLGLPSPPSMFTPPPLYQNRKLPPHTLHMAMWMLVAR